MDILPWMKGFGSEGFIINFFISAFIIYHIYIKPKLMKKDGKDRRKKLPLNPGVKPGDGVSCKENSENIARLETSVENIEEDIKEMKKNNRDDHKLIFSKIDKLKNNRIR